MHEELYLLPWMYFIYAFTKFGPIRTYGVGDVTDEAFGCVQYFADGVNEGSSITFCKKYACSTSSCLPQTRKQAHSFNELLLTVYFTLRNYL